MSDNRPIVYQEGDTWVYRASSVGNSIRTLTAARLEYEPMEPPDYLVRAAEAGNRYEEIVKFELRQRGYRIWGTQDLVEIPVPNTNAIIRGHLDGFNIEGPGTETLSDPMLEVKSMSKNVWDKWQTYGFSRFDTYAHQVSAYMEGKRQAKRLEAPVGAVYAVVCRDHDDLSSLDIRFIKEPPVDFSRIVQKIQTIEFFASRGELPVCTGSQYRCPYDYICDANTSPLFEELEDAGAERMRRLAREYDQIREDEKEIKKRKEGVREDILVALSGKEAVEVPGWEITYKAPKPSKKLDIVKLREKLGEKELEKFYKEEPNNPRLNVREVEVVEDE